MIGTYANEQEQLDAMQAEAQARWTVLDDYKTELCCLDKPELVKLARTLIGGRKYTSKTPNRLMIGHLMTERRRELGYETLLDAIDGLKARLQQDEV